MSRLKALLKIFNKEKVIFEREQDRIAKQIVGQLSNLSLAAKDEILEMVVRRVYPEPRHIHINPKRKIKEATNPDRLRCV